MLLVNSKAPAAAMVRVEEALKEFPDSASLSVLSNENQNVNASKVFVQQKNIAAAGRLLESAVAGGLDDAKVYLALAEVYEAGGYPENAIPAMRRAAVLSAGNGQTLSVTFTPTDTNTYDTTAVKTVQINVLKKELGFSKIQILRLWVTYILLLEDYIISITLLVSFK